MFPDGSMIDGIFVDGIRSEDHKMIDCLLTGLSRHDGNVFWNTVHEKLQVVRLVPEEKYALIRVGQSLSSTQAEMLRCAKFHIEEY